MKRRVTPFSLGLSLGLLLIGLGVVVLVSHMHHALALSNKGSDNADFPPSSHYTLSNTVDVANAATMTVVVYVPGSKPTAAVTVGVTYQKNVAAGPACDDNNHQGWAGTSFSGTGITASGDVADSGIPTRRTTISIATGGWVADGAGFKAAITGTLVNMTHNCGSAGGDGNHVNFTLKAPSGDILGPSGGKLFAVNQGTYGVTYNSTSPDGVSSQGYTTYKIPFASPCTVTTSGSAHAQIYDMDNTGHPVIQPTPAVVDIVDTTGNPATPPSVHPVFSGGTGNGQMATYTFTYQPEHTYELVISNVNLNNILQMQVPFDSVNAQIDCSPQGGITSNAAAACTAISGWMYDPNSSGTQLQYYVYINPSGAAPATNPPAGSNRIGPFTANLANPSGTPGGTPANHGFKVNVPSQVTGHGYNGPWGTDNYYIYAKNNASGAYDRVDSLTVPAGTCASVSCGSTDFSPATTGQQINFTVSMKLTVLSGAAAAPPGNPGFTVRVTGSGAGTNNMPSTAVAANSVSGNYVYSDKIPFTPAGAGTYTVSWSYYGQSGCSNSGKAGYTPYFSVLGGDIAAGAGFGNGSCGEGPADIESWNSNTDSTPNYLGAGSELGALATGDITNFVSGMGLGDFQSGTQALFGHGLSFANEGNTPPNYGGGFGTSITCIEDYYGTKTAAGPVGEPSNIPSGIFNDLPSGNYTASPGGVMHAVTLGDPAHAHLVVAAGKTVTLYVPGNVYIDSNIVYAGYTQATVPRFNLYVQGNIYIDPSVTELHGVYIAQKSATLPGNITTCADGPAAMTESWGACNNKLLVVGSMDAQGQLLLTRTHGNLVGVPAAGVPAEPAEIFRYSPELWLNAPPLTRLTIKAYTSLPPVL